MNKQNSRDRGKSKRNFQNRKRLNKRNRNI